MNSLFIYLLTCVLFVFNFTSALGQSKPFLVNGIIDTVGNPTYFVSYKNRDSLVLDTIKLGSRNNIQIKGFISEPSRLLISIENKSDPRIVGNNPLYEIWIEPNKTIDFHGFKGRHTDLFNSSVRNSVTDSLIRGFIKSTTTLEKENYLIANSNSYFALLEVFSMANSKAPNWTLIDNLLSEVKDSLLHTLLYQKIKIRIAGKKNLVIGGKLPTFSIADTSSRIKNSSDIIRGKYILIDFWASWCGPCRKENQVLVATYKKYKSKGFSIIGVSLDKDRNEWLDAIRMDGLNWIQLSDLKGFNGDFVTKCSITAIPDNFLISTDGTILARKLRSSELEDFLEKILK